ncbi:hypothetical protein OKW24_004858 [Peribacillus simplex]|nr:hypothetical protein [Peribacillus simplex]
MFLSLFKRMSWREPIEKGLPKLAFHYTYQFLYIWLLIIHKIRRFHNEA